MKFVTRLSLDELIDGVHQSRLSGMRLFFCKVDDFIY